MAIDRKYFIHSRGGALGAAGVSTLQDVEAIVAELKSTDHLILHFHGGLVSSEAGFKIAETLLPVYLAGGHPVFYVWESGVWETIRNNIMELADEPVFKQLLRKLLQYTLQKLGATDGARSISPAQVDPEEVRETLEDFIANPGPETIPYKDFVPAVPEAVARSAVDQVDEAEIQADIETDDEFRRSLASLPDIPDNKRSALLASNVPVVEQRTTFSLLASEKFSAKEGQRGLIEFFKVAMVLKDILVGILRRYRAGRDHGLYATVVEEIIRSFKVGGSGINEWGKALQWNRMKKDCIDAFLSDENRAGTAMLKRIGTELDSGKKLKRITLVGHSTGAIYICEWIKAASAVLAKDVKFDVVFLAPAVTYARFGDTLKQFGDRIRSFRMFAMQDQLERDDQVWGDDLNGKPDWRRFIYPSSLLYLVSGILESKEAADGKLTDEPDMPLVGMQRYFTGSGTYGDKDFPEVVQVRAWLAAHANALVWTVAEGAGNGLNSRCNDHGGFDNEKDTLESLRHIVKSGF
jgi:hypothetical protein